MGKPTDIPVYYKRDFSCILRLFACSMDGDGRKEIGFPDYDWVARFHTWWDAESYTASCIGGKCVNCFNDGGRIRVVFDNHRLSAGELRVEFTALLPDGTYPDGDERVVVPAPLGIVLTREAAPCPSAVEAQLMLPYILAEVPVLGHVELPPLPFTFSDGGITPYNLEGIVVYSTHYKRFYRDGQLIPPEELGYNETTESGEIMASTKRLFICGNKHYRFTGRDFVNVETERNPDQRLVRRAPSINAHPGLAYADRGIIRLPQPAFRAGDSIEISLAGLYWEEGAEAPRPLSDLPIHTYTDKDSCDLTVEKEGDKVVVTRTANCYGFPRVSHLWIDLLSIDEKDGYIGVRYDSSGRKIFYRGHKHFPAAKHKLNQRLFVSEIQHCLRFYKDERGFKGCSLAYAGKGLHVQMQVWTKTKVRYRSIDYGYYDDNGITHKYQWHWKDADGVSFRRKTGLVRVRKRAMKGAWSDWCYFHISPFINGGVAESRQKRT